MVELRIGDETLSLSWDEWEARVRSGRVPPSALVRFEPATGADWIPARELELYQSMRNDGALAWRGQFSDSPPLLTALLVGVQIKLWWLAFWTPEFADLMVRDLTLFVPPILEDGQVWRVITMGFSQRATDHLAMNMLWLAYCGWNIERALGRLNLATIYLGSVIFGSVLSMFGEPATPSLGASGGVFGLVGASIVFGFARPHLLPERGRRLFGWALVPYLVVMFASGLASEGTDNWSHFGGLIAGACLGLVLDPPPLQRRPSWNTAWYTLVGGSTAVLLTTFGLLGPRIHPIADSQVVRFATAARGAPRIAMDAPLSWKVPVAWRPGRNAAGDAAFESPAGMRSWSVIEREADLPMTAEDVRATWIERLTGAWPDAEIETLEDVELAGQPAVGARVTLPTATGGARHLHYLAAARGLWSLQATWEVEARREAWLGPLERRVLASTAWDEPTSLTSARIHFEHSPDSPKARDAWATELAQVGRVEEALAIRLQLVRDLPHVAAYWSGLVDLLAWYPDAVDDRDAALQEALDAQPTGAMFGAVADSLERSGDRTAAVGLLDLAWNTLPGERSVRRVRKRLGLSLELELGMPWGLVNNPGTGEPRGEDEITQLLDRPATIAEARTRGAELAAERDAAIDGAVAALESGEIDAIVARTAWFRFGTTTLADEDRTRLLEDLVAAAERDHAPAWMPAQIAAAAKRNPPPSP